VFDNEHSLHLRKRHCCTTTVSIQLTDWREQVTTWRDLCGLLYSHSDIVRLLIQSGLSITLYKYELLQPASCSWTDLFAAERARFIVVVNKRAKSDKCLRV
jgi:hypothetical protein